MLDSVFLHRRFGRLNTEFAEFTDDPWNTPADVGAGVSGSGLEPLWRRVDGGDLDGD